MHLGMCLDRIFIYNTACIILPIIELTRFGIAKKSNRKFFCLKEFFIIMLQVYLIILISVTLFPLEIRNFEGIKDMCGVETIEEYKKIFLTVNWVPVVNTIKDIIRDINEKELFMIKFWITNILGNIILLTPLAVLIPTLFKKFRSLKSVLILCFCTSCLIELLQYISFFIGNMRSADIDDIILNTLGAFIGFGIFKILNRLPFYSKNI